MRTNVYVDGFNLYYGALRGTPYRWLDLAALCSELLPRDTIHRIRYFTARVTARGHDPHQPIRQQTYLRALRTIPNLTIQYGHFLSHPVTMPVDGTEGNPRYVRVVKTEEKGSDVNIATSLLVDAFHDDYDVAVLITNDSDLLAPIRIVRGEFRKKVGILNPQRHPSATLQREADFLKSIRRGALARSQFPETLTDAKGMFRRPMPW